MAPLYGKYNVHWLCEAMQVDRGTFYNHLFRNKKDNTWYSKRREILREEILKIYEENRQIFGGGKITATSSSNNDLSVFKNLRLICMQEKLSHTKISRHNSTQLVKATVKIAFGARNPTKELLFHSDRGKQLYV